MKYGATLKELFHQAPPCLLQVLVGCQAREILNVEYPSIKRRYPDLVVRLEDELIYHLELQTDNDPTMPWRMVEYFGLIGGLYGLEEPPLQQVLYVGADKLTITGKLDKNPLHFEYQVINIQDIDCRPLLESSSIVDNLLAILCRLENKQTTVVKQILAKVSQLEGKARRDYLEKLFIITGLRPVSLQNLVEQESKKVPISVDMHHTI